MPSSGLVSTYNERTDSLEVFKTGKLAHTVPGIRQVVHRAVLLEGVTLPAHAIEPVQSALQKCLGHAIAEQLHPYHLEAAVMEAVWTVSSSRYNVLLQNKRMQEQGKLVPEGAEELAIRYYRQVAAGGQLGTSGPSSPGGSPSRMKATVVQGRWQPAGASPRQRVSPYSPGAGQYGSPRGSPNAPAVRGSPSPGAVRMHSPAHAVAALSHGLRPQLPVAGAGHVIGLAHEASTPYMGAGTYASPPSRRQAANPQELFPFLYPSASPAKMATPKSISPKMAHGLGHAAGSQMSPAFEGFMQDASRQADAHNRSMDSPASPEQAVLRGYAPVEATLKPTPASSPSVYTNVPASSHPMSPAGRRAATTSVANGTAAGSWAVPSASSSPNGPPGTSTASYSHHSHTPTTGLVSKGSFQGTSTNSNADGGTFATLGLESLPPGKFAPAAEKEVPHNLAAHAAAATSKSSNVSSSSSANNESAKDGPLGWPAHSAAGGLTAEPSALQPGALGIAYDASMPGFDQPDTLRDVTLSMPFALPSAGPLSAQSSMPEASTACETSDTAAASPVGAVAKLSTPLSGTMMQGHGKEEQQSLGAKKPERLNGVGAEPAHAGFSFPKEVASGLNAEAPPGPKPAKLPAASSAPMAGPGRPSLGSYAPEPAVDAHGQASSKEQILYAGNTGSDEASKTSSADVPGTTSSSKPGATTAAGKSSDVDTHIVDQTGSGLTLNVDTMQADSISDSCSLAPEKGSLAMLSPSSASSLVDAALPTAVGVVTSATASPSIPPASRDLPQGDHAIFPPPRTSPSMLGPTPAATPSASSLVAPLLLSPNSSSVAEQAPVGPPREIPAPAMVSAPPVAPKAAAKPTPLATGAGAASAAATASAAPTTAVAKEEVPSPAAAAGSNATFLALEPLANTSTTPRETGSGPATTLALDQADVAAAVPPAAPAASRIPSPSPANAAPAKPQAEAPAAVPSAAAAAPAALQPLAAAPAPVLTGSVALAGAGPPVGVAKSNSGGAATGSVASAAGGKATSPAWQSSLPAATAAAAAAVEADKSDEKGQSKASKGGSSSSSSGGSSSSGEISDDDAEAQAIALSLGPKETTPAGVQSTSPFVAFSAAVGASGTASVLGKQAGSSIGQGQFGGGVSKGGDKAGSVVRKGVKGDEKNQRVSGSGSSSSSRSSGSDDDEIVDGKDIKQGAAAKSGLAPQSSASLPPTGSGMRKAPAPPAGAVVARGKDGERYGLVGVSHARVSMSMSSAVEEDIEIEEDDLLDGDVEIDGNDSF